MMYDKDHRVIANRRELAAGRSHQASIRSDRAEASPSKAAHWEAFAYHNGAELAYGHARDEARAVHHAERKAHHLAEWRAS